MPKPKTHRGGVKHRAKRLLAQYRAAVVNDAVSDFLGIENYCDPEYEKLFAQHNPSVAEFNRREEYNSHKPWPFKLIKLALDPISNLPTRYIPEGDPRKERYTTQESRRRNPRGELHKFGNTRK
jgi:hypothetical protein